MLLTASCPRGRGALACEPSRDGIPPPWPGDKSGFLLTHPGTLGALSGVGVKTRTVTTRASRFSCPASSSRTGRETASPCPCPAPSVRPHHGGRGQRCGCSLLALPARSEEPPGCAAPCLLSGAVPCLLSGAAPSPLSGAARRSRSVPAQWSRRVPAQWSRSEPAQCRCPAVPSVPAQRSRPALCPHRARSVPAQWSRPAARPGGARGGAARRGFRPAAQFPPERHVAARAAGTRWARGEAPLAPVAGARPPPQGKGGQRGDPREGSSGSRSSPRRGGAREVPGASERCSRGFSSPQAP